MSWSHKKRVESKWFFVVINIIPQIEMNCLSYSYILCSRPFQRTVTMHKDSSGHVGFIFKSGRITSLVKDGSAARNGLLTDHYICEINGQNVIGLKVRGVFSGYAFKSGLSCPSAIFTCQLSFIIKTQAHKYNVKKDISIQDWDPYLSLTIRNQINLSILDLWSKVFCFLSTGHSD